MPLTWRQKYFFQHILASIILYTENKKKHEDCAFKQIDGVSLSDRFTNFQIQVEENGQKIFYPSLLMKEPGRISRFVAIYTVLHC